MLTEYLVLENGDKIPLKKGHTRQQSLFSEIRVKFDGCNLDGEIYRDNRNRLFLLKKGETEAQRIG